MKKILLRTALGVISTLGFSYAVYDRNLDGKLITTIEPYFRKLAGHF